MNMKNKPTIAPTTGTSYATELLLVQLLLIFVQKQTDNIELQIFYGILIIYILYLFYENRDMKKIALVNCILMA